MGTTQTIRVEVAYAEADAQHLVTLEVPAGTSVAEVLARCREQQMLPEAALRDPDVGVFGRRVKVGHVLEAGERVEIYRPLKVDPKEARRRRAESKRR